MERRGAFEYIVPDGGSGRQRREQAGVSQYNFEGEAGSTHNVRALERLVLKRLPRLIRKRSKVHGYGVFAAESISKNTRIIDYAGELVRNSQCEERESRYLADGCIWVFRINRTWSRDAAVGGNIARFINHACRPNCWWEVVDKTIWIRAARNIMPGEELTYDYATIGARTIPCRCRPGCPNFL